MASPWSWLNLSDNADTPNVPNMGHSVTPTSQRRSSYTDSLPQTLLPIPLLNLANGPLASSTPGRRQTILPPLPSLGPSPAGRSSSPRHHSSMIAPNTTTTTAARAAQSDASNLNHHPYHGRNPSTPCRRRQHGATPETWRLSTPRRHEQTAHEWGHDITRSSPPIVAQPAGTARMPYVLSDDLLSMLVETEFSSPSSYPPLARSSSRGVRRRILDPTTQASTARPGTSGSPGIPGTSGSAGSARPSPLRIPSLRPIHSSMSSRNNGQAWSRSTTQHARHLDGDSQNTSETSQDTILPNDILHEDCEISTADTSFCDNFSAATAGRQVTRVTPTSPPGHEAKRRRVPRASDLLRQLSRHTDAASTRPAATMNDSLFLESDEDLFGESPRPATDADTKSEDCPTIDLTEVTEVPKELRVPQVDKRIKLATFQCVICMDDATTLTVTHCGHLYCAECLHSSLNVESTRGKCPMCRTKIDMRPRDSYNSKTKGYWPLELKLMTSTRKGKRKADALS